MPEDKKLSKKQQDDRFLAVIASIPFIGMIMYFVVNDMSELPKHYSKQSIGLLLVAFSGVIIGIVPILGWLLSCLLVLGVMVGWVVLVINALQGNKFELPIVTKIVNGLLK